MLKACTLFRFKPGQVLEEAREYWRGPHGKIVTAARFFKRYIQSHPILSYPPNAGLPYDGLAEIWVESTQALRDASAGAGYKAIVEDEEKFIDRKFTDLVLTEEHAILDRPVAPEAIKLVHLVKRAQDADPAEYQHEWLNRLAGVLISTRKPQKLVVSPAKLTGYRDGREPRWDVVVTEWHESLSGLPGGTPKLIFDIGSSENVVMTTRAHLIAEF